MTIAVTCSVKIQNINDIVTQLFRIVSIRFGFIMNIYLFIQVKSCIGVLKSELSSEFSNISEKMLIDNKESSSNLQKGEL